MKGVIPLCVKELVVEKFGKDSWDKILKNAGFDKEPMIMTISDMEDATVLKVVESTCKTLGLTPAQVMEAFGDYWVNSFAPKYYKIYFKQAKTAKEFLLNMDNVHVTITKNVPNAKPPRFEYKWKNEKTLVMGYSSSRNMCDYLVGLVKGVGRYFNETVKVIKVGNAVEITFS